jgi:hypothetical protein
MCESRQHVLVEDQRQPGLRAFIEQADSILQRCSSARTLPSDLVAEAQRWAVAAGEWLQEYVPDLVDHYARRTPSERTVPVAVPPDVEVPKLRNLYVLTTWYRDDLLAIEEWFP